MISRYLRLYAYFLQFSFSRAMEFRLDFTFRIVMDCLFYVVQIVFFWVLYRHTLSIGGWNYDQMLIFTAGFLVLDAVNMTVFSNNMWWLPVLINKGDLDYYIVRPVSSLFFVSLREFAANSFINLLIAWGIMAWALLRYPGELQPMNVLAYIILMPLGNFLYYLVHMWFLLPTFWLHSSQGLWQIFYQVEKYAERPHQIFAPWLRRIITSVVPLGLMVSYPTHVLFDGLSVRTALHIGVVTVGAFCVTVWLWGRGLRAYASASS